MLLAADAAVDLLRRSRQEFGSDDHVPALGKVAQRPADILLAGAALIGDGGIVKIHAELQTLPDDLAAVFLVKRPAVLTF